MDLPTASLIVTGFLGILGVAGGILANYLTRKGKDEDHKLAAKDQAFDQLYRLAEIRGAENTRLGVELVTLRTALDERYDRQLARCRKVTDSLVAALAEARTHPNATGVVEQAIALLHEHREDDHNDNDGGRGERP